jgi:cell wall-associated NlpC family hydrolase
MSFDPRLTPARPDLAAAHLAGQVQAARFVEGTGFEVFDSLAPVRRSPAPDAALETEALKGERVTIYDEDGEGWGWGQLQSDGYVGWLPMNALRAPGAPPTHKVAALRTILFPGRSIKAQPVEGLPLGCRLAVTGVDGELARLASGGFVPARHLAPLDAAAPDFVAVAERFIGVPYLWGGKTSLGIDCSGLVQVALTACGIACPRDSDMQRALGTAVEQSDLAGLRRGDLVFWNGHVAVMRDAHTLLHANAFHMAVAAEPVREAVARISAAGSEVVTVKRLVRAGEQARDQGQ